MATSQSLAPEMRAHFRDELRRSRAVVQADAEAFDEVVHVLERLGEQLLGETRTLKRYAGCLSALAEESPLGSATPVVWPAYHASPAVMIEHVRLGRNDAMHQGAVARHLASQLVEVAIVLEDALMSDAKCVRDFMVENPIRAELWHPVSWIRRTMLANSYSALPVLVRESGGDCWKIVSDESIATYLRTNDASDARKNRMLQTLEQAVSSGELVLREAECCDAIDDVAELIARVASWPVLVCDAEHKELRGIVTAFDLL